MKKVVRSIAVVALMFATTTGLAKEPKLSLTPNTEKSLNFEMDITSEKTSVRISDMNGIVIYMEEVAVGNTYSKRFNLNSLPTGAYVLKIENSLQETVFAFAIEDSEITITEKKENVKPVFRRKEEKVFLNLLNLEKEIVKIKVLDSEGRIVFQETISDEMLIEKVFNFEDAYKDNYTITVQNLNDTYSKDVIVK